MKNKILSVVITKLFVLIAGLLIVVIQARALGVTDRGLLASYMVVPFLLVSLTEGGMRQAATYFLGQNTFDKSYVFGSLLLYSLAAGVLGYVVCYLILLNTLSINIEVAIFLSLIVPINVFVSSIKGILLGFQDIKRFNGVLLWQQYIVLILLILFYILNAVSIEVIIYIMLFSFVLNLLSGMLYLSKNHSLLDVRFSSKVIMSMLKKGVVFALALFLIELNYKFDIYMLSQLSDSYNLGIYTVSNQLTNLIWQLPSAVGIVLFSKSSNEKSCHHNSFYKESVPQALRFTLILSFIAVIFLCLFSENIVLLLFGTEYEGSVTVIYTLSIGIVFMVVFKILYVVMAGGGSPVKGIIIVLPCIFLNVLLNYIFIPEFGATAAGVSSSLSYLLCGLISLVMYKRMYFVRYVDLLLINKCDMSILFNRIKFFSRRRGV